MDILIGIACAVGFIFGAVWAFFSVLGDSLPNFIGAFGLMVGSLGFAIDVSTQLGFVESFMIAMVVVVVFVILVLRK